MYILPGLDAADREQILELGEGFQERGSLNRHPTGLEKRSRASWRRKCVYCFSMRQFSVRSFFQSGINISIFSILRPSFRKEENNINLINKHWHLNTLIKQVSDWGPVIPPRRLASETAESFAAMETYRGAFLPPTPAPAPRSLFCRQ